MNKRSFKVFSLITILALMLAALPMQSAQADNVPQSLPFSQNWTNTGLITVNDDWSGVPGIVGFLGQDITTGTGVDPQTLLGVSALANDVDVIANQTNTGITNGGVAEFQIADPAVALQGSGTADAPHIILYLNTTGQANINVAYNVRDLDGSADNAVQQVALQYRVGNSGNFTNIPAGYVADATTAGAATQVTPINVQLPAAVENQPEVQVRIITSNAVGTDEWVGIDDINVSVTVVDGAPSVSTTDPANGATDVAVDANITVNFSENVDGAVGAVTVECPAANVVASSATFDNLASVVIDPGSDLPYSTTCTIRVAANGITDEDTNDPPDTMAAEFTSTFTTVAAPPPPPSGDVVISQVYGGGGNAGATFTHDFVELFNQGTTSASLTGWSVQYASATGTGNFGSNPVTALSGTLAPGQYYLVRLASGGANGSALPAADAVGTVNMSGTAGKVALVNSTTGLACNGASTACSPAQLASIVDLVGYGSANFYEGTGPAPALSATLAAFRNEAGCVDTDDNSADFTAATPAPRNTASPFHSCINQPTVINEVLASHTGTDNTEFLEIYGAPGASLANLSLIVVESDTTGLGTIDRRVDFGPTDTLGINGFFLIGNPSGLGATYGVTPNITIGNDYLENSSMTVALVETSSITGTAVTGNEVVLDAVGITDGGAGDTFFFGAPVIGPDGTFFPAGVRRVTDGADTDTTADWVISDFNLGPANTPTAGTYADVAPTVTETNPAAGATNVPIGSNVSVTFSESVDVAAGAVSVECPVGTSVASNAAANDVTSVSIDPASDFPPTTSCAIVINASGVTDNDGTPDALTGTTTFNFTTGTATGVTPISAIQGSGNTASAGTFTVEAIVVGDYQTQGPGQLRGFFVQEEDVDSDGNPATSEGIFVFCSTCPVEVSVGDQVRVTGASSEFNGLSELTASTVSSVTVLSSNNALPTPANVELPVPGVPSGNLSAATAAINAYFEPFESMLVKFPDTLAVSEYFELARFGQLILSEGGRPFTFTAVNTPTAAGYIDHQIDLAKRTIILDDTDNRDNRPIDIPNTNYYHPVPGLSIGNFVRGGDTIANLTGVLHWSFAGASGTDAWRLRPVTEEYSYAFTSANPRPAVPSVDGRIKVASFNVLNYFLTIDTTASENVGNCGPAGTQDCRGADSADELSRQRTKMLAALSAINADVFGFMEMENTTGVQPLADIVAGLPGYAYIDTGVIGGDAIRVGIIYKTAKVTPFNEYAILDSSVDPRFIDTRNRPVLAQTFEEVGTDARFTVVVNHLKSKGSGCGAGDDDATTGQGNCNGTRTLAAQALADWLATDPTDSGDPDYLIIGDLNSYAKEDPIVALESAGFINMVADLNGPSAYGYVFDGQIGYLDHALASPSLSSQVAEVEDWHINADEIPLFDYNDDVRDTGEADAFEEESDTLPLYEPNEFRTSDHDPVIIGLDLSAPPVATGDSYTTDEDTALNVAAPGVLDNDTDPNNDTLTAALVDDVTNGTLTLNADGSFSYAPDANFNGSDSFTYKASDGSLDSNVATVNITVNAVNDAPVATNDSYSTNEDTALTVAAPAVLSNDSDVENDTLAAVLVSNPSNGTLSLNADGSFTYTPDSNYNGPDSFTYKANDGTDDSNVATVSITVNAVNDAPACTSPQSGSTNEDTALNASVACTDVDNSTLTYSKVGDPSHGTVVVNSDGTFTYTPAANYNGSDSFTFKANDGDLDSNVATFNITIAAVNDNPDAVNDSAAVNKNSSGVILVYLNDTDVEGDTLTVISFTQPAHGTVSYSARNRNFRYTPANGFTGTDTFTYTISDGHGGTDTATVTITVQ